MQRDRYHTGEGTNKTAGIAGDGYFLAKRVWPQAKGRGECEQVGTEAIQKGGREEGLSTGMITILSQKRAEYRHDYTISFRLIIY
jgi:hypothetical protein